MSITAEDVKKLRDKTNAGIMDCKMALTETNGDIEKAIEYLRKKGVAAAEKRVGREAKEGLIESYIHPGSRLGVLVEINCETDFVARNQEFRRFVHDVSLQVAATDPLSVSREDISEDVLEREKEIYKSQIDTEKKPSNIVEKIIQGKLDKFYIDVCLLEQPFVKNPEITIGDYLKEQIAKFGENIVIRRFHRYRIGE